MAMTEDQTEKAFEVFFRDFKDIDGEFKYINKINRMIIENQRSLIIDYEDLILMDDISNEIELADTLMNHPKRMIKIGGAVLEKFLEAENPDFYRIYRDKKFFVRFNNIPRAIKIREIRATDVQNQKIYWLEGIIIRTTEIKSIIEKAFFECDVDPDHDTTLTFEDGVYRKPSECPVCASKKMYFKPEKSTMIDWQFVTLQERPEDLPPGASPKSISCQLTEDIVNAVRPGDRVNIGGIMRSRPSKTKKVGELLTYDSWIEVNFIESSSKEDELTEITPEEEQEFLEMSRDHNVFDHLLNSLAPQIHGLKEVKQAALLMLFGGVDKSYPDGFSTRGQPNVLLVGDPGVAKSQLLRYVQGIAPRGLYTSGKGSSAAGLTAAIIRDPDTGEITLEAGAMVLADRGVCLIDEFDKMNENDRSAIHEAMEQHTVSVAKAGIVATLNARTGVLAAANPKYGRYEDNRSFNENVNLSPAILSRFDLVFILRDIPEEERDTVLADHILKLHRFHGSADSKRPPLDEEKLKKYIAYAKRNYSPALSEEASAMLESFYVEMRNSHGKVGDNPRDRITITARQLEGIIRLAEARARAALKNEVSKNDAQFAIDLMKTSLEDIARDPETGTIDIDALYSGQTHSKRSKLTRLQMVIDYVYKDAGGAFKEQDLIEAAKTEGLEEEYVTGAIRQMVRDGALYQPRSGKLDKP